jgi:hypothetical protein
LEFDCTETRERILAVIRRIPNIPVKILSSPLPPRDRAAGERFAESSPIHFD